MATFRTDVRNDSVAPALTVEDLKQRYATARKAGRAKRAAAGVGTPTLDRLIGRAGTAAATPTPRADDSTATPPGPAAWQEVNLVSTAVQTPSAKDVEQSLKRLQLRDARRRLRESIQRFTLLDGMRACGTRLTGELVGLHVGKAAARFAGLQSCHSVWACPVCQARIRAARSVELEKAAVEWLRAGHGLYMATLTVPHWANVRLASRVMDGHKCAGQRSCTCQCKCPLLAPGPDEPKPKCTCACPVDPGQLARVVEAWRGVQGGTWWVGRHKIAGGEPEHWSPAYEAETRYVRRQEHDEHGRPVGPATVWQEGFRDRWGIVGTTRTIEITYGANGWHSHAHVLIWTEEPATEARAEAIEAELYARWVQRCEAVGLPAPARGEIRPQDGKRIRKGVDVAAATKEQGDAVAKYVIKLQDGGALGLEMTRADLKVARGQKGRTALQLAAIAADGNEQAVALWQEFEFATRGVQCLTWSQGLRERLAQLVELDERQDDEIPDEETAETPEAPTLLISRPAWWRLIVPVRGARADILHAAETGGLPAVIDVLDRLGLVQGDDYAPPEEAAGIRLPSIEQLRRGQANRTKVRAPRGRVLHQTAITVTHADDPAARQAQHEAFWAAHRDAKAVRRAATV